MALSDGAIGVSVALTRVSGGLIPPANGVDRSASHRTTIKKAVKVYRVALAT